MVSLQNYIINNKNKNLIIIRKENNIKKIKKEDFS